jgi:hypothetical protein
MEFDSDLHYLHAINHFFEINVTSLNDSLDNIILEKYKSRRLLELQEIFRSKANESSGKISVSAISISEISKSVGFSVKFHGAKNKDTSFDIIFDFDDNERLVRVGHLVVSISSDP